MDVKVVVGEECITLDTLDDSEIAIKMAINDGVAWLSSEEKVVVKDINDTSDWFTIISRKKVSDNLLEVKVKIN